MGRREERIFRLNDEIAALRRDQQIALDELTVLRHLDDDTQRDAAVSNHAVDRADARETAADVARMEAHVEELRRARDKLERRRDRFLREL